jgi:hypothetical protein
LRSSFRIVPTEVESGQVVEVKGSVGTPEALVVVSVDGRRQGREVKLSEYFLQLFEGRHVRALEEEPETV